MSPTNSSCSGLLSASLEDASLHLRAMRNTDSPLLGLLGTPFERALLHLCTMRDTDSSLNGLIGASLVSAALLLGTMRDTYSSLHDAIDTPLEAATFLRAMRDTNFPFTLAKPLTSHEATLLMFHISAMCNTNPSLDSSIGAPLEAASFPLSSMRDAHSTLNGLIRAPHRPAFCFTSSFIRCNRRPTVAFFHLRRLLLHLRLRLLLDDDAFVDNSSTSTGRHGRQKPRSKRSVEESVG